jgi:GT2 family glycosyltransferase
MEREKEIDVIIPVYLGFKETEECLESVLKTLPPWAHIIAVDDSSPDERISRWLEVQAEMNGITLIKHKENKGFAESVNECMEANPSRDIVLLNSDTEVACNWLERMRAAAYSKKKIASVTPFTNNGYLCSFPDFCRDNDIPDGLSVSEMDGYFARFGRHDELIEIPTGVAFCMYIRRDCLDDVGFFDAKAFGRGYGEETDWCRRAARKGWLNCQQLNLFVYHKGRVSFGDETEPRKKRAQRLLKKRYPDFVERESMFRFLDPARKVRNDVLSAIISRRRPAYEKD